MVDCDDHGHGHYHYQYYNTAADVGQTFASHSVPCDFNNASHPVQECGMVLFPFGSGGPLVVDRQSTFAASALLQCLTSMEHRRLRLRASEKGPTRLEKKCK